MSAIFCHGDEQMRLANESMKAAQIDLKKEIQTVIQPAGPFYQAEEWVLTTSWVFSLYQYVFLSYHQKYILQKHGSLLTSIGLSRGPKLVASSLAARLNGYLGGYGTKVKALLEKASQHIQSTSGELSGRNRDVEPAEPRQHWLCYRWDRASHLSSLLELKPTLSYMPCCLLPMMNTGKLQASRLMNI